MEDVVAAIEYQVAYAKVSGAKCKSAGCSLPPMQKGDFRIGTTGSTKSWFHIECFFKRMTRDKSNALTKGLLGREKIKAEDLARLDELAKQAVDGKKRKADNQAEEDDGRWPKKPKFECFSNIEPPILSNDSLFEIFRYFNHQMHVLRALSLVNKQFYGVTRSIMYKYGAGVARRVVWNMDDKWMQFIPNFQKLSIHEASHVKHHYGDIDDDNPTNLYLRVLTQLSNLSSLHWCSSDGFREQLAISTRLTQLNELRFNYSHFDEEMQHLTVMKSLNTLEIGLSSKNRDMSGLTSFATQIRTLKISYDCFDLSYFTNLENLDISTIRCRTDVRQMIESLPKLTSLVAFRFTEDMSKLTSIKHLTLLKYNYSDQLTVKDITAFPPNLERFHCSYESIKCNFPSSIKSVSIGSIDNELYYNEMEKNKTKFDSFVTAVSKLRCPVTFYYLDIDRFDEKPYAAALQNPKVIIYMGEDRYTETVLEKFIKFTKEGPFPKRLYIKFYEWKKATRKKKFGAMLEELSKKTDLYVEYDEKGKLWRPRNYEDW